MDQEYDDQTEFEELAEEQIPEVAVRRHLERRGGEIELLTLLLNNLRDKQEFVYKVELRAPNKKSSDWLCLIKMVSPDGNHIAFSSGGSMISALTGVARRLRGGSLNWNHDDYPPDDIDERLAYFHKNVKWLWY